METVSELDGAGRGAQGAVGELGFSSGERPLPGGVPDPELAEKARRRRYSAKYKLAVVREATRVSGGARSARCYDARACIARTWGSGVRSATPARSAPFKPKPRGPRPPSPNAVEVVKLRGELDRVQGDLKTARRVIEVQGNVSALLEELLAKSATPTDDETRQR